jgi:hypothetical protein
MHSLRRTSSSIKNLLKQPLPYDKDKSQTKLMAKEYYEKIQEALHNLNSNNPKLYNTFVNLKRQGYTINYFHPKILNKLTNYLGNNPQLNKLILYTGEGDNASTRAEVNKEIESIMLEETERVESSTDESELSQSSQAGGSRKTRKNIRTRRTRRTSRKRNYLNRNCCK